MANIQVSATSIGTMPYTFPLNPYAWECASGTDKTRVSILHGNAVYQDSYWDSRERRLIWSGVYATASYDHTGFCAQYEIMIGWIGQYKYFNFRSIDDMNDNWPVANQWKKARIVDIVTSYRAADSGGLPIYDKVELIICPEQ
jgi:hypothetical protein